MIKAPKQQGRLYGRAISIGTSTRWKFWLIMDVQTNQEAKKPKRAKRLPQAMDIERDSRLTVVGIGCLAGVDFIHCFAGRRINVLGITSHRLFRRIQHREYDSD